MKQPKFKFGDVVRNTVLRNDPFSFEVIAVYDGKFGYLRELGCTFVHMEDELELYREPQKKKLYAYQKGATVIFSPLNFKDGILLLSHKGDSQYCEKLPEYDIEYPVKVTQDNENG